MFEKCAAASLLCIGVGVFIGMMRYGGQSALLGVAGFFTSGLALGAAVGVIARRPFVCAVAGGLLMVCAPIVYFNLSILISGR